MNLAHLHLILNHIPVVGIPIALLFLAYGFLKQNSQLRKAALFILFGVAAIAVPVYLTGEPAEELVEHLQGVAESFIEAHEDAAVISLVLSIITGAFAFITLWYLNNESKARLLILGVLAAGCLTTVSFGYTAYLGGQVRHTELRGENATAQPENNIESQENDDD